MSEASMAQFCARALAAKNEHFCIGFRPASELLEMPKRLRLNDTDTSPELYPHIHALVQDTDDLDLCFGHAEIDGVFACV